MSHENFRAKGKNEPLNIPSFKQVPTNKEKK